MPQLDKKSLSERNICTKFITPALVAAGWNIDTQIREEVGFTNGRIYVRGKIHQRRKQKRVDHILYYEPNIPIAIIEAKDNNHSVGTGMQQALGYADAKTLDIPFVFSSNGDAFLFHDKTVKSAVSPLPLCHRSPRCRPSPPSRLDARRLNPEIFKAEL